MKIGIPTAGFLGWAGGIDFIRMVIDSLASLEKGALEVHVLVPDRGPVLLAQEAFALARFVAKGLLRRELRLAPRCSELAVVSEMLAEDRPGVRVHNIDAGRTALAATCRKFGIDVLLPAAIPLGAGFPIPWIGYVDDFQYRRFPEYYPSAFRAKRDRFLGRMVSEARAIIVNSRATADDAGKFLPQASAEIVVLPFCASPAEIWLTGSTDVRSKYGIQSEYFLISNQFWLHKRHDIAFSAFYRMTRQDTSIELVCTGNTVDGRDPNYFSRLVGFLQERGLSGRVRILGLIPKLEQIELMKNCIAVVQPTSLEGGPGGGSVYDAISLGVPTIVSDIPVNREIEKWVTTYFPLDDVDALLCALVEMKQRPYLRPSPEALRDFGRQRRRECGEALLGAARQTVQSSRA